MHHPIQRSKTEYSAASSRDSRQSEDSQESRSTAPTSIYSSRRPSLHQAKTEKPIYTQSYDISPSTTYYPRSSTETYLSGASEEELCEEPEPADPEYEVPEYRLRDEIEVDLRPSTPQDFAHYFPSARRLCIRHDDTTYDGNMNLRVETEDPFCKYKSNVQLFHMRMHDLKKREFSLRRYERSSGREVCHSSRKYARPASERRANITRSVSNTFASAIRSAKPEFKRQNSTLSTHSSKSIKPVQRQDSGYASSQEEEEVESSKVSVQIPTNTLRLEFSNYAQVEIKRRGTKLSKRYDFEYWGHHYSWKRVTEKDGQGKSVSYHLHTGDKVIAHILPEMRSPSQVKREVAAGGWVPPSSMWISDENALEAHTDLADVIVATGLMALIDDCIKRRFHAKTKRSMGVPLTPLKMEFVGPKAMAEHIFKRRNSSNSKEKEQRGSPLRFAEPLSAF